MVRSDKMRPVQLRFYEDVGKRVNFEIKQISTRKLKMEADLVMKNALKRELEIKRAS